MFRVIMVKKDGGAIEWHSNDARVVAEWVDVAKNCAYIRHIKVINGVNVMSNEELMSDGTWASRNVDMVDALFGKGVQYR